MRDVMSAACAAVDQPANKPGCVYLFRNQEAMLYLGRGVVTQMDTLHAQRGYVYLQLDRSGLSWLNVAMDLQVGNTGQVLAAVKQLVSRAFAVVEQGELRYRVGARNRFIRVLKHPKHGVRAGLVLPVVADKVIITAPHCTVHAMDTGLHLDVNARDDVDDALLLFTAT